MSQIQGYAAQSSEAPLAPYSFERREVLPCDVQIEILYCGICHSDIHTVKSEWKGTAYPCIPGHEIVGKVSKVGGQVSKYKVGDLVAVGCMVDSCRSCPNCKEHLENYCQKGPVMTYNSPDKHTGKTTYGGYSTRIVVDEDFVLRIPSGFKEDQLAAVAPLLCAGITTYSPLKHWKVGKGSQVGVVGLGGLGHIAIKLAHAMGAHVILFTTSPEKAADAKRLGANEIVMSKNPEEMKKYAGQLDFIIDTASVAHNLDPYLDLLKRDGTLCLIGAPASPHPSPDVRRFIFQRRSLAGTLIGGIQETQEMLDFCAKNGIVSDIELIPIQKVNEAYERVVKNDVKYRFVIDIASLKR